MQRYRLALLGVLALIALVWLPALHTPLRFDDTFGFEQRAFDRTITHRNFGDYLKTSAEASIHDGRASPLGIATSLVPWVLSSERLMYKLYLLGAALVALWLLYRLLRRLEFPPAGALGCVLLAGALMQFRWYHDSLLGYLGVMQLSMILLCLTLLAWLVYDDRGGKGWMVAAMVAWLSCLTLYEANLALLPAVAAIVIARRRALRPALRGLLPFALPTLGLAILTYFLRSVGPTVPGYSPDFSIQPVLRTFLHTLVGPLPASYFLLDPNAIMGSFTSAEIWAGIWRGAAVGAAVALLVWRAASTAIPRRAVPAIGLGGVALWVFPSALLTIAGKYQSELVSGQAYLPVFAQTIGVGILAGLLGTAFVRFARRAGTVVGVIAVSALSALTGLVVGVTGTANLRVVAIDQPILRTRELLDRSVQADILGRAPELATVVAFGRDLNWFPYSFEGRKSWLDAIVADRSGRRLDMRIDRTIRIKPCAATLGWPRQECEPLGRHGGWLSIRPVLGGGAVLYVAAPEGRVGDSAFAPETLTVYEEGDLAGRPPVLVGRFPDGERWSSSGGAVRWRRLRDDGNRELWFGEPVEGARLPLGISIDVAGARLNMVDPQPAPVRIRQLGTQQLLP